METQSKKAFRVFCGNMESDPVASRLHKATAKSKVHGNMTLKRDQMTATPTMDEEQRALLILKTHFLGSGWIEPEDEQYYGRPSRAEWEFTKISYKSS